LGWRVWLVGSGGKDRFKWWPWHGSGGGGWGVLWYAEDLHLKGFRWGWRHHEIFRKIFWAVGRVKVKSVTNKTSSKWGQGTPRGVQSTAPVIPKLGSLRQENCECKGSLVYVARVCLKKKKS
jgi:hypothetical protein